MPNEWDQYKRSTTANEWDQYKRSEKIVEEQHPQLSAGKRFWANLVTGGNPEFAKRYLEKEGFEVRPREGWRFEIRKPGEKNWYVMDPKGGDFWERLKDVTDVSRETLLTSLAQSISSPVTKLAIKAPPVALPVTVPLAVGTGIAAGTAGENALLGLGRDYLGIKMTPEEQRKTALEGGISAEAGYVGGTALGKLGTWALGKIAHPGETVQQIGRGFKWPWEKISHQTERRGIEQASKDLATEYGKLNAQRAKADLATKKLQTETQPPISTESEATALVRELEAKYARELENIAQGRKSLREDITKVQAETQPAYSARKIAASNVRLAEYKAWKEAEEVAKKLSEEAAKATPKEPIIKTTPETNIPSATPKVSLPTQYKWEWPESLLYPDTGFTAKFLHEHPNVVEVLRTVYGPYFVPESGSWSMAHRSKFLLDALRTWAPEKIGAVSKEYIRREAELIKMTEGYKLLTPEVKKVIENASKNEITPEASKTVDELFKEVIGKPPTYLSEAKTALKETVPGFEEASKIRSEKAVEFARRRAEIAARKSPEELVQAKRELTQAKGPAARARAQRERWKDYQKAQQDIFKEQEVPLRWKGAELSERRAALPPTEDYGILLKSLRDIPRTMHFAGRGVEAIGKWMSKHPLDIEGIIKSAPPGVQSALRGPLNIYKRYGEEAYIIALKKALLNPAVMSWLESFEASYTSPRGR